MKKMESIAHVKAIKRINKDLLARKLYPKSIFINGFTKGTSDFNNQFKDHPLKDHISLLDLSFVITSLPSYDVISDTYKSALQFVKDLSGISIECFGVNPEPSDITVLNNIFEIGYIQGVKLSFRYFKCSA